MTDFNLTSPPVATLEVGRFLSQTFIKKTRKSALHLKWVHIKVDSYVQIKDTCLGFLGVILLILKNCFAFRSWKKKSCSKTGSGSRFFIFAHVWSETFRSIVCVYNLQKRFLGWPNNIEMFVQVKGRRQFNYILRFIKRSLGKCFANPLKDSQSNL